MPTLTKKRKKFVVEAFDPGEDLSRLRSSLRLSREKFAHVLGYSSRSIASWEGGAPMASHVVRSVQELKSIYNRACDIAPDGEVVRWLNAPNKYLDGMTPLEAISVGKVDCVLRLIILSEEGIPL